MNLEGVLEGLLFVEGDEGVTLEEICSILEISTEDEEYTLRDSETNSVITTVQDEGLLQQYIDNPDYNPYPSGQSPEIEQF